VGYRILSFNLALNRPQPPYIIMGCGASTAATESNTSAAKTKTKSSSPQEQSVQPATKQMSSETSAVVGAPATAGKAPTVKATTAKTTASKKAQSAPAPGVKNVRSAYSGKGWAPPAKEWDSSKKEKGDRVKIEIEDEWDDDGNLKRTITKKTTTADWKFKTEKTIEMYSAEEAKKAGLARQ